MSNILDQLHRDHINQSRLLNLLEREMLKMEKGEDPSYLNMYDIMSYMINYPDVFHHPHEEVLFKKLKEVDAGAAMTINRLCDEHKKLNALGTELESMLHVAISGNIVSKDKLSKEVREYLEIIRDHMNIEERQIFPLIREEMTQDDWERMLPSLEQVQDPLFGNVIADEFLRLYDSIMDKGKDQAIYK